MSRDRLAFYPYVIVRVSCRHCTRHGGYRLSLCPGQSTAPRSRSMISCASLQAVAHTKLRWPEGCGAYYPDLEPPLRPPDLPDTSLRLISGGKRK